MRAIVDLVLACGLAASIATIASAIGTEVAEDKKGGERTFMLDFPDVEGWQRDPATKYDDPRLGYGVGYAAQKNGPARVTVYFYHRGVEVIPDDVDAEVVKQEIDEAILNIHEAVKQGSYDDAKEEESGVRPLGGRKEGRSSRYARFSLTVQKIVRRSELYVLPYKNNFFKVRVTYPADVDKDLQVDLDRLFDALNAMLAKK